jgi:peptidoglycan/xylan/chitin deacetylase (PgdA/CDA1 family)
MPGKAITIFLLNFIILSAVAAESGSSYVPGPARINIILRIDDYGIDNTNLYPSLFGITKKNNIPLTVSVVPYKFIRESGQLVKKGLTDMQTVLLKQGIDSCHIELALHGYSHEPVYHTASGTSEFYGQSYPVQYRKISEGKNYLEQTFKTPVSIFVPPWNAYDNNTLKALGALGFKVVSAAPYGLVASGSSGIRYVPYTTDIVHLRETVTGLSGKGTAGSFLVVVLFHTYDLRDEADTSAGNNPYGGGSMQRMSLRDFSGLISWLRSSPGVQFQSFTEAIRTIPDLDAARFRHNQQTGPLIPVPPRLIPDRPGYYLDTGASNQYNVQMWLYPVLFHFSVLLLFMVILFLAGKTLFGKKPVLIRYFTLAILPLLVVVFIAPTFAGHSFGYKWVICIDGLFGMFLGALSYLSTVSLKKP